ncbi:hypothetical protein JCM6882_000238 [Rhodosporidiobolus microsporus]
MADLPPPPSNGNGHAGDPADSFLAQVETDYSRGGGGADDARHSSSRRSRSPAGRSSSRRDRDREYERDRDRDRERERDRDGRDRDYHRSSRRDSSRDRGDRDYGRSGGSRRYDDYDRDRGGGGDRRRDDYGRGGGRYDDRRGGGGGYDRRPPPPGRGYSPPRRGPPGGGHGGRNRRGPLETFEGFAGERDHRGGGGRGRDRSPTPEDVVPMSKRKRAVTQWDVRPAGFEAYTTTQAKMTGMFNLPGHTRPYLPPSDPSNPSAPVENPPLFFRPPAMGMGMGGMSGPMGGGTVGPGAPIGSQARQSRRLYVGNVGMEATEETIRGFFNGKMAEMGMLSDGHLSEDLKGLGLKGDQPVISVHLNYEKNYAFVEFRNAEECSRALGFDGIVFLNSALKIRRPKDYIGSDPNEIAPHVPGVVSTNVPDTVNKIFIGGLPSYLNDEQVMELLKSFGELRAFNLVKEGGTGASKGFAFCEYVDPSITEAACAGLNGMELGDRYLVVQRAALGANPAKHGPPGSGIGFPSDLAASLGNSATPAAILAAQQAGGAEKTRVLQILNMVALEELLSDEDHGEIVEDIRDECGKFGTVQEVKIPRPVATASGKVDVKASEGVRDLGKVLVLFEKEDEAEKALQAIAGRQFGGRTCICAYAPLEAVLDV